MRAGEPPVLRFDVHPLAAVFPMMTDGELAELAEDIKANGLLHPIIIDTDSKLVDGRNRLRACEIAGIEPKVEQIDGRDARAFIVSANLQRRNLTKGQQAMALAMIYPEPARGRGKKDEALGKLPENGGFKRELLRQARMVLRHDPDMAQLVLSGGEHLDKAHATITARQQEASGIEARLVRLREMAPDLADLVFEERMTLGEALAAAHQRAEERRQTIEAGRRAAQELLNFSSLAVTIHAAFELGERGLVTDEHLSRLNDATTLLQRVREGDK